MLNNLLSNVPLLGPLLTGGKDGGVFAIAYRLDGPLDDLKTDVNILSAVTPGALRELFTGRPYGGRSNPEIAGRSRAVGHSACCAKLDPSRRVLGGENACLASECAPVC